MAGLPSSEDDLVPADKGEDVGVTHLLEKKKLGISDKLYSAGAEKDENLSDLPSCVLKIKSVFKCKICPRIICLTEEILRTHLKSKVRNDQEVHISEFPWEGSKISFYILGSIEASCLSLLMH